MKSSQSIVIAIILICCCVANSIASVTINSVATTASSCTNNGSAVVSATSNPPGSIFYALVAGPALAPLQNSNTFSSLFPGIYTVRVYNSSFDSTETQFQIDGDYQLPNFTVTTLDATCPGFNDGSITVIPDTNSGLQPFSYQMISPVTGSQQSSTYFGTLDANTYFIRLTDACGNYQTRTAVLYNSGTGLSQFNSGLLPYLTKIGCDTMLLTQYITLYNDKADIPITLTLNTSSGTIVKNIIPTPWGTSTNPGSYLLIDTIPGLTYGDFLQEILTDTCGQSVYSWLNQVAPYDFDILFSATTVNCQATFFAQPMIKQYYAYPFHYTSIMSPASFTLVNVATNAVVDSASGVMYGNFIIKPQPIGQTYHLTITDGCGEVWEKDIQWPVPDTPRVEVYPSPGCIDSTAVLGFVAYNFQSAVNLTFLSGPATAQSTKPFYTYHDTIIYPQTFTGIYFNSITVKDLPAGIYTYEVADSCGNVVPGTFTVEPYMVSNLDFSWYIKPSCLNNNTVFYNFQQGTAQAVYASITDYTTGLLAAQPPLTYGWDSITTLPIGQYALEIYYANHLGSGMWYDGGLIHNTTTCWVVYDTINIVPYLNNSFVFDNTIYCNGVNYLELIVDTNRGVPPYKFEILSGPQTFVQQDSGIFQIQQFGNYVVSIEDACGNNYTQQITVSSDSFPPIVQNGSVCAGGDIVLTAASSSYFSYIWQYPNGNVVFGDSISFHPFTDADTGLYNVIKIVQINGCMDTLRSEYYLSGNITYSQNILICKGDTVHVGAHDYTLPGVYYDSLSTFSGCDSVVVTALSYPVLQVDSVTLSICNNDSVTVGNNVYHLQGIYTDTIPQAAGCDKIQRTQLTVHPNYIDSISASVCPGDSFLLGNIIYHQPGIYSASLTSSFGCDSIVVAALSFNVLQHDSVHLTICNGDSVVVNSNAYYVSGSYSDTVPVVGGCDKIQVTGLTVNAILDSVAASFCPGDSFTVGAIVHHQPGIYSDTLTSFSGCDSVVVASLTYNALQHDSVSLSICNGDSVVINGNVYNTAGNYIDTIAVTGSCDKIQFTQLSLLSETDSVQATVCYGDSVLIGQHMYAAPGIYYDSLSTFSGCDSVVVITLSYSVLQMDSAILSICNGDSIVVGNHIYTASGNYSDTIPVSGGCKKIQLTQLTVHTITVDSVTASFCSGDSFTIGSIIYYQPGIYTDTLISEYGCDSVVILHLEQNIGGVSNTNAVICEGESFVFGNNVYTQSGTFEENIPAAGCDSTATLHLTVEPVPSAAIMASNTTLVSGATVQLNCSNTQLLSYNWSGNVAFTNPHAPYTESIITTSTWISLSVTGSNGCSNVDSVYIFIPEEEDSCAKSALYIPNSFTPNYDGVNDFFSVVTTSVEVELLKVYNRWGQEVFAAENAAEKWDGRFKDERCADGVYYYLVQYRSCVDGRKRTKHGSITLLN